MVAGHAIGIAAGLLISTITIPLVLNDKNHNCSGTKPTVVYAQDSSSKILRYSIESDLEPKSKLLNKDSKDFYIPDSLYQINTCSEVITVKPKLIGDY